MFVIFWELLFLNKFNSIIKNNVALVLSFKELSCSGKKSMVRSIKRNFAGEVGKVDKSLGGGGDWSSLLATTRGPPQLHSTSPYCLISIALPAGRCDRRVNRPIKIGRGIALVQFYGHKSWFLSAIFSGLMQSLVMVVRMRSTGGAFDNVPNRFLCIHLFLRTHFPF